MLLRQLLKPWAAVFRRDLFAVGELGEPQEAERCLNIVKARGCAVIQR